jgi:uncharacterized protein (TIGR03437 family)
VWAQSQVPSITSATGASGYGNVGPAAPGSWIEIHGTSLASDSRQWGPADFNGLNAPVSLDGVTVTIGGLPAFVYEISPTKVDALVPFGVPLGPQPVTVGNGNATSAPYTITVDETVPGLWSPPTFNVGGKQYVAALFPDFTTFVLPEGAVPGISSHPAAPGDTVILIGIGFGPVTPNIPAGEIATEVTQLDQPVQFFFGQMAATPAYAGLAPDETGMYQFNLPIPVGAGSGAVPFSFALGGTRIAETQGLWIALSPSPSLQVTGLQNLAGQAGVAVPGDMVLVTGSGFATGTTNTSYPLPTVLADISASFDGFPAPIANMSPQQLQIQVPWEMLGQSNATLTVSNSVIGASASIPVSLQTAAPAVPSGASGFAIQIEGSGGASPAPVSSGSNSRPVLPGEFLDIPAIGLGIQKDGPADGQPATASNPGNSLRGVMVQIGSAWCPVSNAALIPGSTGVSLIRIQVPINAPVGDAVPLIIQAWGLTSSPVSIAVGASPSAAFQIQPADGTFGMTPTSGYPISLVSGTVTNNDVLWSVAGMNVPIVEQVSQTGGFNNGSAGLSYTGPDNTALPEYMLITATLKTNPAIFATSRVLVTEGPAVFHITPRDVVVSPGQSVTFQALDDSGNPAQVSWAIPCGGGNTYSNVFQPESYAVNTNPCVVRAWANNGSADQTSVFVIPSAPSIVSLSPPNPSPGDTVVISTNGLQVSEVTVYFSRLDGSRIAVPATNGDNQISVVVPPDAVEGPLEIDAQPVNSAIIRTAPFEAAVSPKLRLHPEQIEIAQGESTKIDVALLFDPRPRTLEWSSNIGSVDVTGVFSAPASVNQTTYARITACLADRNVCGWAIVAVQPLRFAPAQPVVAAGGSLQLQAMSGGAAVPATWQALTPNVTVSANGLVQAASTSLDGGVARIQVTNSTGIGRVLEVAVTGTQGGMATVAHEFLDWSNGIGLGADCSTLVVIGNRAYAGCTNLGENVNIVGFDPAYWLDTWDITDPLNPTWLASTGLPVPAVNSSLTNMNGQLLVTSGWDLTAGGSETAGRIALIYNLANGIPSLSAYQTFALEDQGFENNMNEGVGYVVLNGSVFEENYATLSPPEQLQIQLPAAYLSDGVASFGIIGNGQRLYFAYSTYNDGYTGQLVTYDLTVSPPAMLSSVNITTQFPTLRLMGNLLLCGTDVYTLDGNTPQLASHLPLELLYDTDASRLRVLGWGMEGMRIVDLTDPSSPRISAATSVLTLGFPYHMLALAPGDTFMFANGELETYPIAWTGGPQYLTSIGGSGVPYDQKSRGNLLFLAGSITDFQGATYNPSILEVYDLTNIADPQLIGAYQNTTEGADAVQLNGNYAFLLCDNDFVVLDISNPATPTKVASIPVGGVALTLAGTKAIIGSLNNNAAALVVVDISNPTAPAVVAQLPIGYTPYALALNGSTLAVAGISGGLYLYDISNPLTPVVLWNSTDGVPVWDVVWLGNLLYTASDKQGLVVREVSNPRAPVTLSSTALGNYAFYEVFDPYVFTALSVYVSGNVAWVGTTDSLAAVLGLDVRDPANPRVIHVMYYGTSLDEIVTMIGSLGDTFVVGGAYDLSFESTALVSIASPGNAIRPAPPPTVPGDIQPPLQLSTTPISGANSKTTRNGVESLLRRRLKRLSGAALERELRALGEP